MALHASAQRNAQLNGTATPSLVEDGELYSQLLRLRDAVIAGKHPRFKLPPAAIEQLKANLTAMSASSAATEQSMSGDITNEIAFSSNAVSTDHAQNGAPQAASSFPGLPGLQADQAVGSTSGGMPAPSKHSSSSGLDPIFLEKSASLVRAEGQLKRQRIERELQTQMEQRKFGMDKTAGTVQDPFPLDVDAILLSSLTREVHISGLKPAQLASPASSFDTNDYYSSQVESEWSSPASAVKGSDRAAGATTADFERLGEPRSTNTFAKSSSKQDSDPRIPAAPSPPGRSVQGTVGAFGNSYAGDEDEDEEYTPPDAAAFDGFRDDDMTGLVQLTPPDDDDDDNSEYEPGEITQESNIPTPYHTQQPAQPSPQVPVIRNHLTHIAAPQPNRVSPLAVAKGPSIELELVNGRPEVVQKQARPQHIIQSRASTVSPANGAVNNYKKKRREKKRKRESEPSGRGKRKRDKQQAGQMPTSPANHETHIKDEPVSPPPYSSISTIQPYAQQSQYLYNPTEIDLVSPRHAQEQSSYANEPPRSSLRYEYPQPGSPNVAWINNPGVIRTVQRDNQDLRRVASLQNAQRPTSPSNRVYSPAPYRSVSMNYADSRLHAASAAAESETLRYQPRQAQEDLRYVRTDRSQSPPRILPYQESYARAQTPLFAPPHASTPRKIVVDQYGNRYYAPEPVSVVAPLPRQVSLAPVDRPLPLERGYDRAPSRVGAAHGQTPSANPCEQPDARMAPPPLPRRQAAESQPIQYIDSNPYRVRDYNTQPMEQIRYVDAPISPKYQQASRYEPLPAPTMLSREPTSPVYTSTRSYSVRPEQTAPPPMGYAPRQASAAPVQYVRQDAQPPLSRAMSVMPGYEQAAFAPTYSQAPQHVQYVDQYGRPVFPSDARQLPRYQ